MNTTGIPANDAVDKVLLDMQGMPAFLTGSSASAVAYGKLNAYTDIDVFVPNQGSYFACVQRLLERGYHLESDKFEKMWRRHLNYGFNRWHTNSMKLIDSTTGTEVNVIYKLVDGHETTRLSQVLESFDFGLLGVGYETATGQHYDMRPYFFPTHAAKASSLGGWDNVALPMLEYRKDSVSQGFMSQFVMLRTAGRYARYANEYGYDLSEVKPTLVEGYTNYASYKRNRTKPEDLALGDIAERLAQHIEWDEFDELHKFEKSLPLADEVHQILESLE